MSLLLISYIVELIFLLVLTIYLIGLADEFRRILFGQVPFVPSTAAVIQTVIDANVLPKEGMILDLGCGNGKALRKFERAGYKGPLIGYERAPSVWLRAKLWNLIERSHVRVRRAHFDSAPLEEAKGVYVFLLTSLLKELAPTFRSRLKPGTVVVSAEFPIADWVPVQVLTARGITSKEAKVFVYKM
jgi:SAM-dependent methyltransferase